MSNAFSINIKTLQESDITTLISAEYMNEAINQNHIKSSILRDHKDIDDKNIKDV